MRTEGSVVEEETFYPAHWVRCEECSLVQLDCIVSEEILFPKNYPYTSGTTRILVENFKTLAHDVKERYGFGNLCNVLDIGSNDGTLLKAFAQEGFNVFGIEPTDAAQLALKAGIPTEQRYFTSDVARDVVKKQGSFSVVTATNVFAHIDDLSDVMEGVDTLLADKGVFVSESHDVSALVEGCQYDTIYHEHMRYYSVTSLKNVLERHGYEIHHAHRIATHGGSIRVYASRKGAYPVCDSVLQMLERDKKALSEKSIQDFIKKVSMSKLSLMSMLCGIRKQNKTVVGIGAPSRASTLVHYVGLDASVLECVLEIKGSKKIGFYMPGTVIPVRDEEWLYQAQPDYALLFSWHIAEELIPKLKSKGYKGHFIVPLPEPVIVSGEEGVYVAEAC